VVASGCTDRTVPIVQDYAQRHPLISLLVQERRQGKASAINAFLQHARSADLVVLESADTLPADVRTVERLLLPFITDSRVGMTGVHPVPVDTSASFLGFVVNLQWSLHHRVSSKTPKLGEMVAFRNILPEIPADTAVDEASIEALIEAQGYGLRYVPDSIVYNKGPDTINDFLKQRRRIAAGHHHLRRTQHYVVSTLNPLRTLASLLQEDMVWSPKGFLWTIGAIILEVYGRSLGLIDFYIRHRNPFTWDIATTTKRLKRKGEVPGKPM
jgi:cellulose synthase/poly-beta-1,6-N-acetylglucosamine synthase-like glycosyltransferase